MFKRPIRLLLNSDSSAERVEGATAKTVVVRIERVGNALGDVHNFGDSDLAD